MKFGFYNFELVNRTNFGYDRIKFGGKVYVGPDQIGLNTDSNSELVNRTSSGLDRMKSG